MVKCEQCDREFAGVPNLRMHAARVHGGMGPGKGRKGRTVEENRAIWREQSKRAREKKKAKEKIVAKTGGELVTATRPVGRPAGGTNGWHEMTNFKILSDRKGGIWLAERIR